MISHASPDRPTIHRRGADDGWDDPVFSQKVDSTFCQYSSRVLKCSSNSRIFSTPGSRGAMIHPFSGSRVSFAHRHNFAIDPLRSSTVPFKNYIFEKNLHLLLPLFSSATFRTHATTLEAVLQYPWHSPSIRGKFFLLVLTHFPTAVRFVGEYNTAQSARTTYGTRVLGPRRTGQGRPSCVRAGHRVSRQVGISSAESSSPASQENIEESTCKKAMSATFAIRKGSRVPVSRFTAATAATSRSASRTLRVRVIDAAAGSAMSTWSLIVRAAGGTPRCRNAGTV